MENNENTNDVNKFFTGDPVEVIGNGKLYSALAYIGPLWLIGLLVSPEKDTRFVKNHVNNGLVLFLASIAGTAIVAIPVIGWIVGPILDLAMFVFAVIGFINAIQGNVYSFPYVGDKLIIIK